MTTAPVVFVVDDDPSLRSSLKFLISSVGLQVESFDSAEAVLQRKWKPLAYRGMEALVELFGQAPRPLEPQAVSAKVQAAHHAFHAFLSRCGLDAVAA
jgi:CheY-like chemotaxis protein